MLFQASFSFGALSWGVAAAASALVAYAYLTYRRNLRAVGGTPGVRTCVAVSRAVMLLLPSTKIPYTDWYFSIGPELWMNKKHALFREHGQDILSVLSIDLEAPSLVVADADAIQEILGSRARFTKPVQLYKALDLYGHNVLTTENEEWRVHRKIAAPTFSEVDKSIGTPAAMLTKNNNRLVREETIFVIQELFETWKGRLVIPTNFVEITMALTLMVICGAGFGKRVSWVDTVPPVHHQLTFKEAIKVASSELYIKVVVPDVAMGLTKTTSRVQLGFEELQKYIQEMIQERTKSYRDCSDLFSNLIAANENDSEGLRLTDQEMVGNVFIFLIAGHETTADIMAFAVGLLALYPEVQEKLYQYVVEMVADPAGAPTYEEVATLTFVTAVFYETLRLFPPVTIIPKQTTENTSLRTQNTKGEPVVVPVPKGCFVNINVPALHQNPRYWKDPEEFQPERFLDDWPKNAFVPFSIGARACIGRRFAEVEAIITLSMLVRNYRIEIQADPRFAGETFQERRSRILAFTDVLSLRPKRIPVNLIRR